MLLKMRASIPLLDKISHSMPYVRRAIRIMTHPVLSYLTLRSYAILSTLLNRVHHVGLHAGLTAWSHQLIVSVCATSGAAADEQGSMDHEPYIDMKRSSAGIGEVQLVIFILRPNIYGGRQISSTSLRFICFSGWG